MPYGIGYERKRGGGKSMNGVHNVPAHEVGMVKAMKRSGPTGPKSTTVGTGHPLKRAAGGGGLGTKHGSRSPKPSTKGSGYPSKPKY